MKTRWSLAEATKHIKCLAESGKSAEAFATLHELPAARLRYWQKRLAVPDEQAMGALQRCCRFVSLPMRAPIGLIIGNGRVVRVIRGFHEENSAALGHVARKGVMFGLPPSFRIYYATRKPKTGFLWTFVAEDELGGMETSLPR